MSDFDEHLISRVIEIQRRYQQVVEPLLRQKKALLELYPPRVVVRRGLVTTQQDLPPAAQECCRMIDEMVEMEARKARQLIDEIKVRQSDIVSPSPPVR